MSKATKTRGVFGKATTTSTRAPRRTKQQRVRAWNTAREDARRLRHIAKQRQRAHERDVDAAIGELPW